jgi:PAS domain S-box-containing protein
MISILYVDDEPALVDIASHYLRKNQEMVVDTAKSVATALTMLEMRRYDAIVSDYFLPDTNGISFLKTLRTRYDETPFILFTGRGREEIVIEALNHGAAFYLQKGGDPRAQFAELGHMVAQAVERRRADQELLFTRYSVDHASDEIFWYDGQGQILYVNDASCRSLGYTREELLAKTVSDIDPEVDTGAWTHALQTLREKGTLTAEYQHQRKDGSRFPVEIAASYHRFEGKEYVFAFSRDLTWRKQTEKALQESEQLFRSLVATMPDATLIVDWEGTVLFANEAAFCLVGLDPGTPLSCVNIIQFVAPEFHERVLQDLLLVRNGQDHFLREYRLITLKGEEKWVEGLGAKITFRGKEADLVCVREVTERKRAEQALRASEERFREVFHNANDGIALNELTEDGMPGRFIEINETLCSRLLYSREELLSCTPEDLGFSLRSELHQEMMHSLLQMKPVMFETMLRAKNGIRVPVEVNSHLCVLDERRMILSVVRDITERKIMEEVENKAFGQIERNIDQLAILGDHIRNPLAVIIGFADLIESDTGRKIIEQARIIDQIITRLDMQWIESEKVREFVRRHYREEIHREQERGAGQEPPVIARNASLL